MPRRRCWIPQDNPRSLLTTNRTATLHGSEPQPAEREQSCGRRDLPGHGVRAAGRAGQHQPDGDDLDQDCGLRNPGALRESCDISRAVNTAWTKVQGTFSFSNLPGPPTSLMLYFQSSSATDSFYISDVIDQRDCAATAESEPAGQHRHHKHI